MVTIYVKILQTDYAYVYTNFVRGLGHMKWAFVHMKWALQVCNWEKPVLYMKWATGYSNGHPEK